MRKNVKYLSSFLQLHNWGHSNTHLMACIYRNCLEALRPYHGILLLYEERELLDKLPLDASPTLKKMLSHASPTNSFRTIASDSDLALLHVRMSVKYISTRGISIQGEVRHVWISRATQQLLCSKSHDFLAIFALAHSKINQIA